MSERIVCICGRAWTVRRYALPQPCDDCAVCLCGHVLKRWSEASDYIFEPVEGVERLPEPLLAQPQTKGSLSIVSARGQEKLAS